MSKVSVLPVGPFDHSFSYLCENELAMGTIVKIPFGSREVIGVITDDPVNDTLELKEVCKIFPYQLSKQHYDFLVWMAEYTLIPRGQILKMFLAEQTIFSLKKTERIEPQSFAFSSIQLENEQQCAYQAILQSNSTTLLHGVTGSGKTEVYMRVVQDVLKTGKQVLIMLPEIALTQQTADRIKHYCGAEPLQWNSDISPSMRRRAWRLAESGTCCLVVGTRSALFLPYNNLGLIIVDEEHDTSYKQEEQGCYNARDMAILMGHQLQIPVILASATPSLESYANAICGKYQYITLKKRYGSSQMPLIEFIDMRQNKFNGFISPPLEQAIQRNISKGEQTLIYVNRRGYAPLTLCSNCGEKIACPDCSTWLVYHKKLQQLVCHYCGYRQNVPNDCHACGGTNTFIQFGAGVERIRDELLQKIPNISIAIASSDTLTSPQAVKDLITQINENTANVIIGTQILSKGHHFDNITLAAMIDGDFGLQGADIRTTEHAYQVINQVAGRTGRGDKRGKFLIQTFNPKQELYTILRNNEDFFRHELEFRRRNNQPPFAQLAAIVLSGTNRTLVEKTAKTLMNTPVDGAQTFGPAPAPIFLMRGRVRWRILFKVVGKKTLSHILRKWLHACSIPSGVKIQIDIDPYTFS